MVSHDRVTTSIVSFRYGNVSASQGFLTLRRKPSGVADGWNRCDAMRQEQCTVSFDWETILEAMSPYDES